MKSEEQYYDLCLLYLGNQMNSEERLRFEKELKSNTQLSDIFKFQSNLSSHLREESNRDIKSQFVKLEEKLANKTASKSKSTTGKVIPLWSKLSMAASIALLAGFFYFTNVNDSDSLYEQYFTAYPNELIQIERGDNDVTSLQQAFINYGDGKFEEALVQFEDIDQKDLDLYRAVCYMKMDQHHKALSILDSMDASQASEITNQISWYQALSLLKLGNEPEAKKKLLEISQSSKLFRKSSAKELLNTLN